MARVTAQSVQDVTEVTVAPYRPKAKESSERKANGAQETVSADKAPKRSTLGRTVRVDVDLLDFLMNMVGELVIDRTRLTQLASRLLVEDVYKRQTIVNTIE